MREASFALPGDAVLARERCAAAEALAEGGGVVEAVERLLADAIGRHAP